MRVDDELENMGEDLRIQRQSVGIYKLKDQPGRDQYEISNSDGEFMVLKAVRFKKIPRSSKFEVILFFPDPEDVEVTWRVDKTRNKRAIE